MKNIDNRAVYADPAVAARFDAERGVGRAGDFVNSWEIAYFIDHARALSPGGAQTGSVIDVGAGTGKLALAFAAAGWRVTALDQSEAMLERLTIKAQAMGLAVECRTADIGAPAPVEPSHDVAVSSRVLMHVADPAGMIAAMAGFARCGVVLDAPRRLSPNQALAWARRMTGGEVYRCFDEAFLRRTLADNGLTVVDLTSMFALPISLHLKIKTPAVSRALERLLRPARRFASTAFITAARRS
jgi:2-polyprenyl-3-methyl-5-hydroxy-6-metoxy-1,4-benzoquinol methylase